MQIPVEQELPATISDLRNLGGFPARVIVEASGTPERCVKIPGTIRKVGPTGITVDLMFPLTTPRIGAQVVLEVMTKTNLTQCFTLIQHTENPQCIHLRVPEEIHRVQRRRSARVEVSLSGTFDPAGKESEPLAMQITNLSLGGMAAIVGAAQEVGRTAVINLRAAGLDPAEVTGRVLRCSPYPKGQWSVGVAFEGLSPEQESQISKYIALIAPSLASDSAE